MKRMVVNIQPFIFSQTVEIYNDNKLEKTENVPLLNVTDMIKNYTKNNNIEQIEMFGSKPFANRIKNNLLKSTEFNKAKDIKIIIY